MTKEELEKVVLATASLKQKCEIQLATLTELQQSLRRELMAVVPVMDNAYRRRFGYKLMCEKCGDDKHVVENIGKYFCKYHGKYFQ